MEAPGSSPPPRKKQKVTQDFYNLREEEEQLFSGPKKHRQVSKASRRFVRVEENRLIINKKPLRKKVVEIMAKCGLKKMSNDVYGCLSLCVEKRMRGLISNAIRLSKQRFDLEKPRHKTIITSDVRQQIMTINRKACEEWEKKLAETEKSKKPDEAKKGEDHLVMAATNTAVRNATGVSDMLSRWQSMIEAKNTRENQAASSAAFTNPASIRKVGRNQAIVPRVARSISVKDVIAILEREPQMSKSSILCL